MTIGAATLWSSRLCEPIRASRTGSRSRPWKRPNTTTHTNIWWVREVKICHLEEGDVDVGVAEGHQDKGQQGGHPAVAHCHAHAECRVFKDGQKDVTPCKALLSPGPPIRSPGHHIGHPYVRRIVQSQANTGQVAMGGKHLSRRTIEVTISTVRPMK